MTNPLTAAEIAEAKALCEALDDRPWPNEVSVLLNDNYCAATGPWRLRNGPHGDPYAPVADAAFSHASRSLVPRLLAENEALKAALRLAQHQLNPFVHPLTCGFDSRHVRLVPIIRDGAPWLACGGSGRLAANLLPERCAYMQAVTDALVSALPPWPARALLADGSAPAGEGSGA